MRSLAGAFLVACILFCGYLSGSKRPAVSAGHAPRETPVAQRAGGEAQAVATSTNVLRFTVATVQIEGVYLSAVWPDGLIAAGSTLDLLGKASLDQSHWTWVTNVSAQTAQTNAAWQLPFAVATTNRFFKMSVRETLPPMDDSDGDGLPNVYEAAHGTNPWRDDAADVPRLLVGPEGDYPTLAAALQASDPFDIVELEAGVHIVGSMVSMHCTNRNFRRLTMGRP